MMKTIGVTAMCAVAFSLSGCYEAPPTNWSTVVMNGYYYPRCPSTVACVVATRGGAASASVASYNGATSVTSSAGNANSAVATNGTAVAVAAQAGGAYASGVFNGDSGGISTSAGTGASASLAMHGGLSSGSTNAGTANNGW